MATPFRTPISSSAEGAENQEEWKPPDYFTPSSGDSKEEWKAPDYFTPAKKEETKKPSVFSKVKDYLTKPSAFDVTKAIPAQARQFLQEHPKIREIGQRLLTGTSPEAETETQRFRQEHGVGPGETLGPGLSEIPGVKQAADFVRAKGRSSGSYAGGFLGSVAGDVLDFASSGFDPRTAGVKGADFSIRQPSREIPYKASGELPSSQQIGQPKLPRDLVPVGGEEEYNLAQPKQGVGDIQDTLYETAKKRFRMGEEWKPPDYFKPTTPETELGTKLAPYGEGQLMPSSMRPTELSLEPKKTFVNPFEKPISLEDKKANIVNEARQQLKEKAGIETEKSTAEFLGLDQEKTPYYNIVENDGTRRTFKGPDELNKRGIEIPETPKDAISMKGEDLRAKMLAERKGETWTPPDYFKPQAARTKSGKLAIGADVKSLGKVLGTSLYKGDIAPIATKELLQNSIDATRHLGEAGEIRVALDRNAGTIHVGDNGKGLTKRELESVFTDLGASGKREDVSASGGFGLAKAAPLLGGEKVEVSSVSRDLNGKLHEYSFSGSPNELLEGVDLKHRIPDEGTPTGTKVTVHTPKDSDFYSARQFVERLAENSPNIQSKIHIAHNYDTPNWTPNKYSWKELNTGKGTSIAKLDNPSATTELIEPESSTRDTRGFMQVHLSNNGMYQGTKVHYFGSDVPNAPGSIIVDINSKVPEGHADYPFTANREELRGTVEKQVEDYINENIIKPGVGKRLDELKRLYNSMTEITVGKGEFPNNFGRKIAIYDPKGQITQSEMQQITSNPAFHTLADNLGSILDEAMKSAGTPEWKDRLEKFGFIFSENLHGIHIPNPETGKSAILVNPFVAIGKMSPDEASANILHTILHEMAHLEPAEVGHNEAFTIRLGEIYAKYGARRSIEAQDTILQSIADPNTGRYNPEIQEILSTYKTSRGREATTEDLLSGTGIGSKTEGGGEGSVSKPNKSAGERAATENAVNKLLSSLGEAKGLELEQRDIYSTERAKRFSEFMSVKQEGAAGAAKSLGKLRGEYEKIDPGKELRLSPKQTDTLFTAIKRANITPGEKARGYTALFKLLDGQVVPQRSELKILDDVFGNGFGDKIIEMHGGIGAVGLKLSKLANTMKSMQNSISLAAPLRHGIGLVARKEFAPAFADMFKFFANKDYYQAGMKALEERPTYMLGREGGLFLSKPNSLQNAEEEFLNSYVGSVPGVRNVVGASQRAYTGFLNKLRADTFDNMIKTAKSLGNEAFTMEGEQIIPSKSTKAIANFINNATGRGSLGRLNNMTNELNTLFWSPRMIASRINMLTNPNVYLNLPKGMRLEGLKSLFGIAALGTIIDTLAAYGGAKISSNILSTDFGKSRFGKDIIDPWGGFQQYIVGAARFLAGKTDSPLPTDRLQIAGRFLANKESPAASLAHQFLTAKKFTGGGEFTDQYNQKTSVQGEVAKRFTPIFIQDLMDLASSEPDFANNIGLDAAMAGASLTGMAQQYPERKPKGSLMLRKQRLR